MATATRPGTWLRHPKPTVRELTLPVRLTPPELFVLSIQNFVTQGGAGVVVYRVGETSARDGVQAGEWFFPGAPLPGGADAVLSEEYRKHSETIETKARLAEIRMKQRPVKVVPVHHERDWRSSIMNRSNEFTAKLAAAVLVTHAAVASDTTSAITANDYFDAHWTLSGNSNRPHQAVDRTFAEIASGFFDANLLLVDGSNQIASQLPENINNIRVR